MVMKSPASPSKSEMPRAARKYTTPKPDHVPKLPKNKEERVAGQWYTSQRGKTGIWDGRHQLIDYEEQRQRVCLKEQKRRKNPNYKLKRLYRTYGLTTASYTAMFEKQQYKCAICEKEVTPHTRLSHVDHDHETGKIRGILCHPCNIGLGFVEKDGGKFRDKCVNYLRYTGSCSSGSA